MCERLRSQLQGLAPGTVLCDVHALAAPDIAAVAVLARLTLVARRLRCDVQLVNASDDLRDLLAFAGLGGVLPTGDRSGVEPRR